MDIIAIVGLLFGFAAVLVAMVLKHIPFSILLNPAAAVVIFAGTIASVLVATPASDLKNIGKLFGVLFGKNRYPKKEDVALRLIEYAGKARQGGFLSLESSIAEEPDPFVSRCLQMLVDGVDDQAIEEAIFVDIEAMQERHAGNAQIFSQAGSYAPTLGVLGAVLGLVAALSDLSDTDALSTAISAAFIATVLGIFTGYVMWNPMANRLKRKSNLEVQMKNMVLQGVCDIARGKTPSAVKEGLMAYLTQDEQKKAGLTGESADHSSGGK